MKIRRIINDFLRFEFQLRRVWLLIFVLGLVLAVLGVSREGDAAAYDLLMFIGGAAIGFASSAFFSCPDQFLLRGSRDAVYLIENGLPVWRTYRLADRETMNALGGVWHEVAHVSERKINHVCKDELSLKQARLYRPEGENSAFAVLNETRYGIPDQKTRERIWGSTAAKREEVERFLPGRDLVSVQFWPLQDQKDQSASRKSVES